MIDERIYGPALILVIIATTVAMLVVVAALRGARFDSGSLGLFGAYFTTATLGWAYYGLNLLMGQPPRLDWAMPLTMLCALLLLAATGTVPRRRWPLGATAALLAAAASVLLVLDSLREQAMWQGLCSALVFSPLVVTLFRRARADRNVGEAIIASGAGILVLSVVPETLGYLTPGREALLYGSVLAANAAGFTLAGIGFLSSILIEEHKKLTALALHDPLTGLMNRRGLQYERLRRGEADSARAAGVSVIVSDIDHFKRINDSLGHDGGDAVLVAFSALLARSVRDGDVCCRLGGEEFLVVLNDTPMDQAMRLAERLRERVEALEVEHQGRAVRLSASFGVASGRADADMEALIKAADKALYQAKSEGRNRVVQALETA